MIPSRSASSANLCFARHDCNDPGDGDNDGGDTGGSGSGGDAEDPYCDVLRSTKPAYCPNPILFPSGAYYGEDHYSSGSGLQRSYVFLNTVGVKAGAFNAMRNALAAHTSAIANRTTTFNSANAILLAGVQAACQSQRNADAFARDFGGAEYTYAERVCMDAYDRLTREAQGAFTSWFLDWLDVNGIDPSDWLPQTLINYWSPGNSLKRKFNIVTSDAQCSEWWDDVAERECEQ